MPNYKKIAQLKTSQMFLDHLAGLNITLPFEGELSSTHPLAQPLTVDGLRIANRFCVLPMEGWDGTPDGHPSANTFRRWQRFGCSGAKLIWGGEAVAVRQDGRANPNQLMINAATLPDLIHLRETLVASHIASQGSADGLVIGLQLTHSGRYARPNEKKRPEPRIAYDHPLLNRRAGLPIPSDAVFSDGELDSLVGDYVRAAWLAREAGFDFVDVKLCHGYLGHELLSAVDRPGRYGGSFANRTRFPREIIHGIRRDVPHLRIGVRFSAYDFIPFHPDENNLGVPEWGPFQERPYPYAFGGDGSGLGIDLSEPIALVRMLGDLGVHLICITAGSPYYCPHIQRPAYFPPSDGYLPPEDPLIGVGRLINAAQQVKAACPQSVIAGTGYSALQDWLPQVALAAVRQGYADLIGLGRMMLAYPDMPADILAGRPLQRKRICRTLSDCTTAPRAGLVSGCYPLDEYYKTSPQAVVLDEAKKSVPGR